MRSNGLTRLLQHRQDSCQKTRQILENLRGQYRQDIAVLRRSARRYGYDLTDLIRQAAWRLYEAEDDLRRLGAKA